MKTKVEVLDAVPSKRLFLSIISDYDLEKSICELVDNALDVWVRNGRRSVVRIDISLDPQQQTVSVKDDAGGIKREELSLVVSPGRTGNELTDQTIGIFGVGTKRAVVALAQDVKIRTRKGRQATHLIQFDEEWINDSDDWNLDCYEVDSINPGTTVIELSRLRKPLTSHSEYSLHAHLGATYSRFIKSKSVGLYINSASVKPISFEGWSFPPRFEPRRYSGKLEAEGRPVDVEVLAGLSNESSPGGGEYGVYLYCNDRLVGRALKTFEFGFSKGFAGAPHPKISLTRVIIYLRGDARSMPWNSSKSDIDSKHVVFQALRDWLVQVVSDYAQLSRIWMGDWQDKVLRHTEGTIKEVAIDSFGEAKKSYLPAPPKSRPRFLDIVTARNQRISRQKPWSKGLYEGVIASEMVFKLKLSQKNRMSLILLDSTIEIAFKEYLVNESGHYYTDKVIAELFLSRHKVDTKIRKYVQLDAATWRKLNYYHSIRNKFVHERATATIPDDEIESFSELVQVILNQLYGLRFT